jgi:hypothetical protein
MEAEITISLAVVLLVSQVAVVIVLIVLFKKFKALKDEVNSYKIKNNRKSLPSLIVAKPKDENKRPVNEYVDGKRHPSTLVRHDSEESIVYVPTPCPERRSMNLNEEEASYGESAAGNSTEAPVTPHIEEIHENDGFTKDAEEERYDNQVIVDMVKRRSCLDESSGSDVLSDTSGNARDFTNAVQSSFDTVCRKETIANEQKQTYIDLSEMTSESYDGHNSSEDTGGDITTEPIYENLRGNSFA